MSATSYYLHFYFFLLSFSIKYKRENYAAYACIILYSITYILFYEGWKSRAQEVFFSTLGGGDGHPFTTTIIVRGILPSISPLLVNYTYFSFRNNNNCLSGVIRFGVAAERFPTDERLHRRRASEQKDERDEIFFLIPFTFFRSVNCTPPRLANAVAVAG